MCPVPCEYDYGSENISPRAKKIIDLFYPVCRVANHHLNREPAPNDIVEIEFGNKVNQTDPIIVGIITSTPTTHRGCGVDGKSPHGPCGDLNGGMPPGGALSPGQRDRLAMIVRGEFQEVHWPPVPINKNATPRPLKVTSYYGKRKSPGGFGSDDHKGWDIRAKTGTPIKSPLDGKVFSSGKSEKSGNFIWIIHELDGDRYKTFYCHGDRHVSGLTKVVAGQTIMYSGNTGKSTGEHLHFGVKKLNATGGERWIDPKDFIKVLTNTVTMIPATDDKSSSGGDNPSEEHKLPGGKEPGSATVSKDKRIDIAREKMPRLKGEYEEKRDTISLYPNNELWHESRPCLAPSCWEKLLNSVPDSSAASTQTDYVTGTLVDPLRNNQQRLVDSDAARAAWTDLVTSWKKLKSADEIANGKKSNESAQDSTSGSPTPAIAGANDCVTGQVGEPQVGAKIGDHSDQVRPITREEVTGRHSPDLVPKPTPKPGELDPISGGIPVQT
jgi:murein DD-endopeptidase MepM/ murein hydrolase activator NlpD